MYVYLYMLMDLFSHHCQVFVNALFHIITDGYHSLLIILVPIVCVFDLHILSSLCLSYGGVMANLIYTGIYCFPFLRPE